MNTSPIRGRRHWLTAAMLMLAALVTVLVVPVFAANPAPVQVFYLAEPEDDMLPAMHTINSRAVSPIVSRTTIAISANNTIVYYDHWENGFAADIANPTTTEIYSIPGAPGGVQIWGNGIAADGCAPVVSGDPVDCTDINDVLNQGDVIILTDDEIVVPNTSSSIDWDGKDKIAATNAVAVSRALWAETPGPVLGWAMAMMPTTEWGQVYTAPVGCNTPSSGQMFEYSAFSITAAYDGTEIQVDPLGNGNWVTVETLDEGETHFIDQSTSPTSGCPYIRQGQQVRSSDPAKPIQVALITGDIDSSYASRDINMVPDSSLSSSYWIPVGNGTGGTTTARTFIHNPEATPLYVKCDRPGFSQVYTIAPGATSNAFTLGNDQAGHCHAVTDTTGTTEDTSRKFSGLLTIDTNAQNHDWALPFIPDTGLSNQALVGLGAGRDWNSDQNVNGSPLWVTPVCATYFYVDWDNDGVPDKVDFNGTNGANDSNVNGLNETTSDQGFLVQPLQSVRLYKPGGTDQTGAYIYTRTGPNNTGEGGCNFAAAWGQDPRRADTGAPYLDMGTIIVALRSVQSSKAANLINDVNGDGEANPGDTVEYVISINNIGLSPANVSVYDTVPAETTYVDGSTEFHNGTAWSSIPDDGSGTTFPLDNPAPDGVALGSLPAGATWQVRFQVTIDPKTVGNDFQILNCARLGYDSTTVTPCVATDVIVPPEIEVTKTANPTTIPTTGGDVTYTFTVTNVTDVPVEITSLTDSVFGTLIDDLGNCVIGTQLSTNGASCSFTKTFTLPPADEGAIHLNVFKAVAKDLGGNITEDEDPEPVLYSGGPSISVTKTAGTPSISTSGGPVTFTYTVTNNGTVKVTIDSLTDDKFGPLDGEEDLCEVGTELDVDETCQFTETFILPPGNEGDTHTNVFTTVAKDENDNKVDDDDDATVIYFITNVCLDSAADNRRTDILGVGMGNPKKHQNIAKVMIPNWNNAVEVYAQLAGKQEGLANYVRFMRPGKNDFIQVSDITAYAPRQSAVFWYGTDIDPAPNIRGRWFLQKTGQQKHIPRALVVYPTYQTPQNYVNVFELMEPSDTQVYWDVANGWVARQEVTIAIPAPQVMTTFHIKAALVDNDKDPRPIFVTMNAGGVSQTLQPINPDRKDQLNILQFTLENVPDGTSSITLTIESPAPNENQMFPLGGDSGAVIGVTANYLCADIPLP